MYSTIFDGKSCTWTHFVAFEMADKAKLSRTLLLTALYCIYMRRINFDSATVNISVLIKQRNISFQGQNDISQRAVRKVKESWAWTTWGVEEQLLISSSCLSPGRVKKLQKFKNYSANLKHSKSTWRQLISSYRSYKIRTSKALGTMQAQHFFITGTFGNDRSIGQFRASRLIHTWVTHLYIAVPTATRSLRYA